MIFYYVFLGAFGLFAVTVFAVGTIAFIQHRRQPLEKRLDQARQDLLNKETRTGYSELHSGAYSKITKEMLRDIAKSEGFHFVKQSERSLNFQRTVVQDGEKDTSSHIDDEPIHARGDLGDKHHRKKLGRLLEETADDAAELTLRRDQLGALPKAEILRTSAEHGWEYQTEEISGNEWRLLFQRGNRTVTSSPSASETAKSPEPGRSTEQELLARLEGVTTDISGVGQVSLADLPGRVSLPRFRELAASRGWDVDGTEYAGGQLHLQVKRSGTSATAQRLDLGFLSGPSLTELRDSAAAREEAERVLRETGVDVDRKSVV